jgi:hypothetical protein
VEEWSLNRHSDDQKSNRSDDSHIENQGYYGISIRTEKINGLPENPPIDEHFKKSTFQRFAHSFDVVTVLRMGKAKRWVERCGVVR